MEFWRFIGDSNLGAPLHPGHQPTLVLLSILIACLTAYAAFAVVDRISDTVSARARAGWLSAGALAMGSGMWAMHFTAMLAHTLPIEVGYNLWITLLSVVPAIIGSGIALSALSRKDRGWKPRAFCGLLLAIAIGTMHYVGMEALEMNALLRYDPGLFVLSIAVAYLLSTLALNVRVILDVRHAVFKRYQKFLSTAIMGCAIAGMHYTAMAASRIYPLPSSNSLQDIVPPYMMATAILLTVSLIIGLAIVGTIVDQRLGHAQKSLLETEAWADNVINTTADGIVCIDSGGIILSFNRAAEKIFGYESHEVVGRNIKILTADLDLEIQRNVERESAAIGNAQVTDIFREIGAQRKDGSSFPLELGITEMMRKQQRVFIASMRDVTRRKQGEIALQAHARQQAAMAELGHFAVIETDLDRLLNVASAKVAEVLGADYCKVLELLPDGENLLLRAGVGWHDELVGSAVIEASANDSQAGYTLASNTPVVVENLPADSRFNGPELLRSHAVLSGVSVLITAKRGVFGVLGVHSKLAQTFTDDDVNFVDSVANMLSQVITKNQLENQRNQMEMQLAQAQKLESIGQLAAGVAHEINTPTQFVGDNIDFLAGAFQDLLEVQKAYAQLLDAAKREAISAADIAKVDAALTQADNDYLIEEIPHAIEQSVDGVQRIAKIVSAMKAFSHMGADAKELFDLNTAISNTVTVARNEWKYVAEMQLDLDQDLPLVPCYPAEFNQVVLNLVVNAAHAIGDVIDNSAGEKGQIRISSRALDEGIEFRISDTGKGIPEGVRERIFDPFFTTKDVGKGTGQGLSIAHATVVDKHGGTLNFETEAGKGTTFVITIPLEDAEALGDAGSAAVTTG